MELQLRQRHLVQAAGDTASGDLSEDTTRVRGGTRAWPPAWGVVVGLPRCATPTSSPAAPAFIHPHLLWKHLGCREQPDFANYLISLNLLPSLPDHNVTRLPHRVVVKVK